jgi:hypothetical protein
MSTDFRVTQMQARKYIRFDSTQELHTRVMSAKRRDYRIIARARAPDRSLTRSLAHVRGRATTRTPGRATHARSGARMRMQTPALPIFPWYLRGSRRHERAQVLVVAQLVQARQTVRGAMRLGAASVSNRNGAHAHRNRIFLHRRHHIFVVETLQTRARSLETRRESSDSAQVIRLAVRRRAASSAPRSPLAGWLCRWSTS